jgi:GNAT superfamily N-acetyltransferase
MSVSDPIERARARLRQNVEAKNRGADPAVLRAQKLLEQREKEQARGVEPAPVPPALPEETTASLPEPFRGKVPFAEAAPTPDPVPERPAPPIHNPADAAYRFAGTGDLAYILSSWSINAGRSIPLVEKFGADNRAGLTWLARRLVSTWGARICCDAKEPDIIWGWACVAQKHGHEPRVLFVYVRDELRGNGYARGLLADLIGQPAIVAWLPTKRSMRPDGSLVTREERVCVECNQVRPDGSRVAVKLPKGWTYSFLSGIPWALTEVP